MRRTLAQPRTALLLHVAQVLIASNGANVLLYLFLALAGRSLSPQEFGLFGALMGIITAVGTLANALQVTTARLVANARALGREADVGKLVGSILVRMTLVGGALFVALGLAAPALASFVHSENVGLVLLAAAAVAFSMLLPPVRGAFQGMERFVMLSTVTVVNALTRLALGAVAVVLAMGLLGLMWAVTLGTLLAAAIGLALIWRSVRPVLRLTTGVLPFSDLMRTLAQALAGSVAAGFLTNIDVVIVRHFFPGEDGGFYAAAATLGRIVLFIAPAVSVVLFPMMARAWANGHRADRILLLGLGLTALLSGALALGFSLLPGLAIRMVVGPQYVDGADLVPIYLGAVFLLSLVVMLSSYHLATGRILFPFVVLLPHVALGVALPYFFHDSVAEVALLILGINASMAAASAVYTLRFGWRPRAAAQGPSGMVS